MTTFSAAIYAICWVHDGPHFSRVVAPPNTSDNPSALRCTPIGRRPWPAVYTAAKANTAWPVLRRNTPRTSKWATCSNISSATAFSADRAIHIVRLAMPISVISKPESRLIAAGSPLIASETEDRMDRCRFLLLKVTATPKSVDQPAGGITCNLSRRIKVFPLRASRHTSHRY